MNHCVDVQKTRYKLCKIDVLDSNVNVCTLNENNEIKEVEYVYRRKSRTGLSKYNVRLVEDTDIYLLINRDKNLYHYDYRRYGTAGLIITINVNCNQLLDSKCKRIYKDYIVLTNKEIESLIENIDRLKISKSIPEIVENYNKIRRFIEEKVEENKDLSYYVRKNLYKLVKYNLYSYNLSARYFNYETLHFLNMKHIYEHTKEFNDKYYVIFNCSVPEVRKREDNRVIGYILDDMLITFSKFEFDADSYSNTKTIVESDDFVEVKE